jgi:hypothetical protein
MAALQRPEAGAGVVSMDTAIYRPVWNIHPLSLHIKLA